jgi:hypothetical protein
MIIAHEPQGGARPGMNKSEGIRGQIFGGAGPCRSGARPAKFKPGINVKTARTPRVIVAQSLLPRR